MQTPVSVKDKKSFIEWFLNNHQLKKRESVWILNYIINHDIILENIHFVRDAKFCPRSIIISTQCSNEIPFRFYKNHVVTNDAEKSFHDIRLNQQEALYIQLNFKNVKQNPLYVTVLEENPYIPDEFLITKQDQEFAAQILDQTVYEFRKKHIIKAIDLALDNRDKEQFQLLTESLRQLESRYSNQPF
ncbi:MULTISPECIES: ReoY family proteolytic degradation factor [unclassified Virgibacillus]|uniref:ReoY family proteolytic degradation factor n=1 Tax=unclassified Virgibacillus TaxID=2620237 RepID=UPI0024DEFD19|nr:ReoY family proteolytic degradation factor [Virgibacillus sp. LDC-1]